MLVYTKIALIMKNKIRSKNGIRVMPVRTVGRLRRRQDSCFHPWANFIEARRCSPAFASKSKFSFFHALEMRRNVLRLVRRQNGPCAVFQY